MNCSPLGTLAPSLKVIGVTSNKVLNQEAKWDVNDVHDRNRIMVWDFVTGTTRCEPSSSANNVQAGFTTEDFISFNKDTVIIDGIPMSVDIHVSMQEVLLHSGPACRTSLYGSDVNTRVPGSPTTDYKYYAFCLPSPAAIPFTVSLF